MEYAVCEWCFRRTLNPKLSEGGDYTLCPECREKQIKGLHDLKELYDEALAEMEESESE